MSPGRGCDRCVVALLFLYNYSPSVYRWAEKEGFFFLKEKEERTTKEIKNNASLKTQELILPLLHLIQHHQQKHTLTLMTIHP